MPGDLILVLDEGTTSTRAMIFTAAGLQLAVAQRELIQHYPAPGHVEHDPAEIWDKTLGVAQDAVRQAGGAERIAAIGITNQRETVVAWDKAGGQPLSRALVWQDRRTAAQCGQLRAAGHEDAVREKTGLLLDPYFSATKMRWLIDNEPQVAAAAAKGTLAFGTIESWLLYNLTGGAHLSDASNASRTLLLPLEGASWDAGLCDLFGVPSRALPEVCDNAGPIASTSPDLFGRAIPICGLAGDQQSATIGQACLNPGDCKATYGTGAFVLSNMGSTVPRSANRLLGTVLRQLGGQRHYALEGSVFVAGSLIQWLRDTLGIISSADETARLAASIPDSGGVTIVPALSGLGAPHWRPEARGAIAGLSFNSGKAQIARAALEAMSHQTHDLARAFEADDAGWTSLRIDGGMSANDWMAQDLADILRLPVERPDYVETTALGAAVLAALGVGLYPDLESAARSMRGPARIFEPMMEDGDRRERLTRWQAAIASV
ncbi:glycerol kinase GlpK [Tsuneonella sp. CC-YZS046]|uniref:glycerol kinase GlpK n=1 Tax=Tsuneonella sp. CC-YZS046 TaxID=3042152 RepID=UPI002D77640C|nr:glycerol kinase GlpK [Tsuneonella sp. CC-YZS046]WRO65443.1 glycerol kinase GlpK [Tsuneonella sp. CC-YZS046]